MNMKQQHKQRKSLIPSNTIIYYLFTPMIPRFHSNGTETRKFIVKRIPEILRSQILVSDRNALQLEKFMQESREKKDY